MAGDVADGAAHFLDVAAAPGGGFAGIVAEGEFHMEAGVVDGAEFAFGDPFARLDVEGVVDHHVVDGKRKFPFFGGVDHLAGVGDAGGHRFFDDHVLAGFERGDGELGMGGVVGGDVDGIEIGIGDEGVAGVIPFEAECFGGGAAGGVDVGGGFQNGVGQFGEAAPVAGEPLFGDAVFGDAAEADHAVLDFFHDPSPLLAEKAFAGQTPSLLFNVTSRADVCNSERRKRGVFRWKKYFFCGKYEGRVVY